MDDRMWVRAWVLAGAMAAGAAAAPAGDGPDPWDDVRWMAGCWAGEQDGGRVEENWGRPDGGSMLGTGRVVAGGKTVFTEFMQIHDEGGVLVMSVVLGLGKPEVSFKRIRRGADEVVFSNPDHDFPQRIVYRREKDGSLFARIEGREQGVEKGEDYRMRRASCQ